MSQSNSSLAFAAALILLAPSQGLFLADPPAPAPTAKADPAALVREIRDAEAWITKVKSLRLKVELGWFAPPAPDAAPATPPVFEKPSTIVMGFDDHRLYFRQEAKEYLLIDQRTWDGKVAVMHSKYSPKERNQEQYSLDKEPWQVGQFFMGNLSWPRAGPVKYWWERNRGLTDDIFGGEPEDFRLAGRENFRGTDCHVLESDLYYRTLYVGVADHRLYGLANRVLPRRAAKAREPITRALAAEMGAKSNDPLEMDAWLTALSPEDRRRYWKQYFKRLREFSRPQITHWYADHKELAPGRWMPMHQGYDIWSDVENPAAKPTVTRSRDIRITEAVVDQPLPDKWFVWEFTEGVELYDRRSDPILIYKYKKHFEPAEWAAILDDAAQRKASVRPGSDTPGARMSHTGALGKPAPEFPTESIWINGPPMTMSALRGEIVIVVCFASWSKFSLEDIPALNDVHAKSKDDVIVIGVHAADTPADDVRKWVQANGVRYPVCIDDPPKRGPWDGDLFNDYHVVSIPNAYVIDRTGRVNSVGTPAGAITHAKKLAAQPTAK